MLVLTNALPHHPAELLGKPLDEQNASSWLLSTGGVPLSETLPKAIGLSVLQRALLNASGECVCLWGVVLMPNGFGNLWILSSKEAAGQFECPQDAWHDEVATMLRLFGPLFAFSQAANSGPCVWLEKLGFKRIHEFLCEGSPVPHIGYVKELPPCAIH